MTSVKPIHYDITFKPDLKKFRFSGEERILIDVKRPTSKLVLNSVELTIDRCYLINNEKILRPKIILDDNKEELGLKFSKNISGKAELFIKFRGKINDKLVGFYRSKYNADKKEKYIATTQFEAAYARHAFPCWDHPEYKATFDVTLVVDKEHQAISNMPVAEEKKTGDKKSMKFQRTPMMSTYLLYLGIGEFEFLDGRVGNAHIRVITTLGKKQQGQFALESAKKFLKAYEDYFGIKYPLPKLDLIAIPDFAAGAMENWGAMTFRETALLYDHRTSAKATKQRIAEVISHEIAHQWFGNLVTMKWWNDLWLNESFATFMATKIVDKFYPEWDLWSQWLSDSTEAALRLDSLKSSHPIEVEVETPSEITQIFDQISYEKGGNILKMLEAYMGEGMFRKGLKHYLETHRFGNADTEDLWESLEKVSRKPIRNMMDGWVKQTGYPMIDAKIKNSKLKVKQKRFLLEKTKGAKGMWFVPLSIKLPDKTVSHLLRERSADINVGKHKWLKINHKQNGFYRVKYPKPILDELKNLIKKKELSNVDRWGIQNDLFALAVAGEVSLDDYLDFIKAYENEDDYLINSDIAGSLYYIHLITTDEKFWPEVKKFNREFFRRVFDRLGWEPRRREKHTDALLRSQIIVYLGRMGDDEILENSKDKFNKFLKKPQTLHPDIRSAVFSSVAWGGDEKTHKLLLSLYRKAKTQEEKIRFLVALCAFQDKRLLKKSLDFSLSHDVRTQDLIYPVMVIGKNPYGRSLAWSWVKKNWAVLKKRLGKTKMLLSRVVYSASSLTDRKYETEIRKFFKKNPTPGTERAVEQTLESISINGKFLKRIKKSF